MSHFRRANYGRFTSASANEHYQRQLVAPVNKWKKQWVSPSGLAPESSYKICKWVKQKEKAKLAGAIEVDDNTPAIDEDENENEEGEGEDQDMDEDEQDQGEDEEGDGEIDVEAEAEEDAKPSTTNVSIPIVESTSVPSTEGASISASQVVPSVANPAAVESVPNQSEATGEGLADSITAAEPLNSDLPQPVPPQEDQAEEVKEDHEASIPKHATIPSNAIEISNVAPSSTEVGLGTIATSEPTFEIESRAAEDVSEEKMEIEKPTPKEVEDDDKGLIHGEMDAPVQALEVEGGDVPKEVEKE
ncbi:uncharacterized protein I206_100257 [Kwoniella pini CBS 10737]|uniref:Uncharacterized protein n=1 Tax=Kwoniella pini CBS 10737 TaxID=1296096 RepID=A0A1B9IEA6_9TREE|nr:uncharacterized protein I206_01068 [Kwoniella pini CBS 10737]OCF53761.1 hypothetical protein I206_01068 [Kwoniella pini CBS 10737]